MTTDMTRARRSPTKRPTPLRQCLDAVPLTATAGGKTAMLLSIEGITVSSCRKSNVVAASSLVPPGKSRRAPNSLAALPSTLIVFQSRSIQGVKRYYQVILLNQRTFSITRHQNHGDYL